MGMNAPLMLPELDQNDVQTRRWMVVIYNDDVTPHRLGRVYANECDGL